MRTGRQPLWILAALLSGCRGEPRVVEPPAGYESATLVVLVPMQREEPAPRRARIIIPGSESDASTSLIADEDETVAILLFDAEAQRRGFSGEMRLDRGRVSLEEGNELDCGPRGRELREEAEGMTRIRQALTRFRPAAHRADPFEGATVPVSLADLPRLAALELEFVGDVEACRRRWRPSLVPLDLQVLFGDGLVWNGEAIPSYYYDAFTDAQSAGSERLFLVDPHALLAVRRGARFDFDFDDVIRIEDLGLPKGDSTEEWQFSRGFVTSGVAAGSRRWIGRLRRYSGRLERDSGWAIASAVFDGRSFEPATILAIDLQRSGNLFERDEAGTLILAGEDGHWAAAGPPYAVFERGVVSVGEVLAIAPTTNTSQPHVLSFRRGPFGYGDIRASEGMRTNQLRSSESAMQLEIAGADSDAWLYSGWSDGEIFRSRLTEEPKLESSGLELPHRWAKTTCGEAELNACGRGRAAEFNSGLEVRRFSDGEDLILATFERCHGVILHEVATSCTTVVDFPDQNPEDWAVTKLRAEPGETWVFDAVGRPYELELDPLP